MPVNPRPFLQDLYVFQTARTHPTRYAARPEANAKDIQQERD